MLSETQPRVSMPGLAAIILISVLPARVAWAHGEQLLVNFGVTTVLIPLWLYVARRNIQSLPEGSRRQTWTGTWVAAVVGVGWAIYGSNLVSSNSFLGPSLSFGALSITALPCAVALARNGQVVRCFLLLGIPVLFGVLFAAV
jgi:hypothetical protein